MTGASFSFVTVIVTSCVALKSPSLAVTVTSKTLSPSASPGVSKSGASIKLTTPVAVSIVNRAASAPPSE